MKKHRKKYGFTTAWSDKDILNLIQLRNGGRTWEEVAEEMGRTKAAVNQYASTLRKRGYGSKIVRGSSKKKRPLSFLDGLKDYSR